MNGAAYISGGATLVLAAVVICLPGLFAWFGTRHERRAARTHRELLKMKRRNGGRDLGLS